MTFAQENSILSLVGTNPEGLLAIEIQKLMFVFSQEECQTPLYDFIPYQRGCYSPTLAFDIHKLSERRLLVSAKEENGQTRWSLTESGRVRTIEHRRTAIRFASFRRRYSLRGRDLLVDVYRRYPYFCIRSEIAGLLLRDDAAALDAIKRAEPKARTPLASIGYEGRSFENYLNSLIKNGITILCDVRKNPISRKYGFSKATLKNACDGIGVKYRHYPDLGIPSYERQDLRGQADYDELFQRYERDILPKAIEYIYEISNLVVGGECVALTCFEANPAQCHRTRVLNAVERKTGVGAELI